MRTVKVIFLGVFFKGKFENSTLTILTTVVKIRMFSGIPTNGKWKVTYKFPSEGKVEDLGRMSFVELVRRKDLRISENHFDYSHDGSKNTYVLNVFGEKGYPFFKFHFGYIDSFTTVVRIVKVKFVGVFFKGKLENSTLTILTTVVKIRMFSGIPTNVKLQITLKFPLEGKVEDLGRMSFVELVRRKGRRI